MIGAGIETVLRIEDLYDLRRAANLADAKAAAEAVAQLVAAGVARRQAAELVARLTGLSRKGLYDMSL